MIIRRTFPAICGIRQLALGKFDREHRLLPCSPDTKVPPTCLIVEESSTFSSQAATARFEGGLD